MQVARRRKIIKWIEHLASLVDDLYEAAQHYHWQLHRHVPRPSEAVQSDPFLHRHLLNL